MFGFAEAGRSCGSMRGKSGNGTTSFGPICTSHMMPAIDMVRADKEPGQMQIYHLFFLNS